MKTDFFFREKVFLSEIVGKKDRLSNRAEQLSNRAERLSTRAKRGQTAKRSQTAQRSQTVLLTGDRGKGKFSQGKKKRLRLYFPSPGTHHWHHGGYIFFLIWSLFNHKSITSVHFGRLFLLAFLEYYRSLMLTLYFLPFFNTFTFTRALQVARSYTYIHLRKMNVTPLAVYGVKWPFSKGSGGG